MQLFPMVENLIFTKVKISLYFRKDLNLFKSVIENLILP